MSITMLNGVTVKLRNGLDHINQVKKLQYHIFGRVKIHLILELNLKMIMVMKVFGQHLKYLCQN